MLPEKTSLITEASLYAGFNSFLRTALKYWRNFIIEIDQRVITQTTIQNINRHLTDGNSVVLFDHHYAFDAIPASLALSKMLSNVAGAIIPYAAHLDMGVDPEGLRSYRYRLRKFFFRQFIRTVQKVNSNIHLFPVVREFELETPRLKTIADKQFKGANIKYLKSLVQIFSHYQTGQLCILSPMGGIAFPEKPVLHPLVYRSMELVQAKYGEPIPFFFIGAYPQLRAHYHYYAPLLNRHTVVMRGPFYLPTITYQQAYATVDSHLRELRQIANFVPPDYSRIAHK